MSEQLIGDRPGVSARLRGWWRAAAGSARFRLRVGLLVALVIVAGAWSDREPTAAGLAVVALGMAIRLWASGHLHKREALAVSGPYRWIRHPLYLGTLVAIVGGCVMVGQYLAIPIALAIMIPVYLSSIAEEERDLREHFGQAYDDYCARVPRLIPRPWPGVKGDGSRFSFRLALENRWHQGAAAVVVAVIAIDVIQDVIRPWLVDGQPLGVAARGLLGFRDLFRTGRF